VIGEQQLVQRIERDEVLQRLEGDDARGQAAWQAVGSVRRSKVRARVSHVQEDTAISAA
jgi:hypothetical protein